MHTISLIAGDGIGPEVVDAAVRAVEATGVAIQWERVEAGAAAFEKYGNPLPAETLASIRKNRIALKGPLETQIGSGFASINVALRKEFDLYVNFRPVKSFPGVKTRFKGIDLVVFRENTEEFYTGIERYLDDAHSAAELTAVVTRRGSERIIRYAFAYARANKRKKVTLVHKANILKLTHGLFRKVGYAISQEYPDIVFEERIADTMAMQLSLKPKQFDVIVTTNFIGDILSDLCAGLVGGLGFAPSANIGDKIAMFEAVHGTAPKYAGKNVANPTAVILAAAMMLDYLGEHEPAQKVHRAVAYVIKEREHVTQDINPEYPAGTREMTDAIVARIKKSR